MGFRHPRFMPPSWRRLRRRTARLRLTALYAGLILFSGVLLLGILYLLVNQAVNAQPGPPSQKAVSAGTASRGATNAAPHAAINTVLTTCQDAHARKALASWMGQLLTRSGIALGIVTVVAVALGWLVAARVLRPLATITATARRISASSLHERLAMHGPDDELKDLGDTLDDLFARLQAAFEAQRHFVANASHELRSPVTRERTLLQVALADPATATDTWRSTSQEVLAANVEQEQLIEALLTLASSEGGLDHSEPVDLSAVTGEVLLAPRPEIDRLGLRIVPVTWPATLEGDPLLVERLVANLIDNAVRHNVVGGHVKIATRMKNGSAVLSVTNSGPVIPPGEVDRLFQPFQRLHARRVHHHNGHGLGLSIVRAIATAHGAAIDAYAEPDGGMTIDVTFPPPANPHGAPSKVAPTHTPRGTGTAHAGPAQSNGPGLLVDGSRIRR
jgi:signal transduction histidine kinase